MFFFSVIQETEQETGKLSIQQSERLEVMLYQQFKFKVQSSKPVEQSSPV